MAEFLAAHSNVQLHYTPTYSSWLNQVEIWFSIFAVSDDHPGLKRTIIEVLAEAYWQRRYVHFLRNALDYLLRKVADDCLIELRWLYDRRNDGEARRDPAAWLLRWQEKYPRVCAWVEENIEEPLTSIGYPRVS